MTKSEWEKRASQLLGFDIRDDDLRACYLEAQRLALEDVKDLRSPHLRVATFEHSLDWYFEKEVEKHKNSNREEVTHDRHRHHPHQAPR